MRATLLLCDAAQAIQGKLYILGGGWSFAGPGPPSMAIALKIEVPWNQANRPHTLHLSLVTEDGESVKVARPDQPDQEQTIEVGAKFEVGRPPGIREGTPLDYVLALNVESLPLPPGKRYEWRLSIDGEHDEDWTLGFTMRPVPEPGEQASSG